MVYINRFRQLASDHNSMDFPMNYKEIYITLLSGLQRKFEQLIVDIDAAADEKKVPTEFGKIRLLQEERKILDRDSEVSKNILL